MNTIEEQYRAVGYKVFDKNLECRGFKYEIGKTFKHPGEVVICHSGFHLCDHLVDCFNYYAWDESNRVCVVVYDSRGAVQEKDGDKKAVSEIYISHELTWDEVMRACNMGKHNTGHSNTGDWNTGDWNTGDSNTGYRNTGHRNTGDSNTGHRNTGDSNTGHRNTGDWNTGDSNTGDSNTGDSNTGHRNTGHRNTGDWNTGDRNTGHRNTGHRNTGDSNTGDWNTGDSNTGHRNTGDWNTGDSNTGYLCAATPKATVFDLPTDFTHEQIRDSDWYRLLSSVSFTKYVWFNDMKPHEIEQFPSAKITGGYNRKIKPAVAWRLFWRKCTAEEKEIIRSIPNFTAEKWAAITGIKNVA